MMAMSSSTMHIRPYQIADEASVIDLCSAAI
jgi:hypothetical protein